MNIFYLSPHPQTAAQWHCDKHVVKMILEYAQLLSTAHHELDGVPSIECYKSTHKNHPSAVWARENVKHYRWLWALLYETCAEYTRRYGKVHATERKGIVQNLFNVPHEIPKGKWREPPQCMPDEYKHKSTVKAYQNYYVGGKREIAKWNYSVTPCWYEQQLAKEKSLEV